MKTLLIVDEQTMLREAIAEYLIDGKAMYSIFQAATGKAALDIIDSQSIALMLLDVGLSDMSGIDSLKHLRKSKSSLEILILTMFDEPGLIIYLNRLGVEGILMKNAKLEELEKAISDVLKNGSYLNTSVFKSVINHLKHPGSVPSLEISRRELEVLALICKGKSNKDIAELLNLKLFTIESYRKELMLKTKCTNTAQLVAFSFRTGLHPLTTDNVPPDR